MRKVAILQPNYIPWKGVFDLISRVDCFVFLDDVQYTSKDWRNRNKIKTPNGEIWLSVPVHTKGRRGQLISEAQIETETSWQEKHFRSIRNSYSKAPFFKQFEYLLEDLYLGREWLSISDLSIHSTMWLAKALDIEVEWYKSSDLSKAGSKDGEKALKICNLLQGDYFINGPSSRDFMDESLFIEKGVTLEYIEYDYPEYPQLHGPFVHQVSVLDVLFNCGPSSRELVCRGRALD
jgi:hypothetical protein